jgi:hypothetical protein
MHHPIRFVLSATLMIAGLSAQAAPTIAQSKPAAAVLALDSGGLRVVNSTTGSTRSLSFGMKEADALTIVTNLRGKPKNRGINSECGAGPLGFAQWNDGLTLQFQNGRFVGWDLGDRNTGSKRLTTLAGIGIGTTRTALTAAYSTNVSETSLGTEFTAGKLSGLLSGPQRTAKVTSLWSGTTCIFR